MYTQADGVAAAHGCLIGICVSVVVDADDGDEEQAIPNHDNVYKQASKSNSI